MMAAAQRITILGSTGSIGVQTLDVMALLGLQAVCLTAGRNTLLLEKQARLFHPRFAAMSCAEAARDLKVRLADTSVTVLSGPEGVCEAAAYDAADTVVAAITGIAGLAPVLASIRPGRRIALANKESLVCAGALVMNAVRENNGFLLPVDSEHSALFQCLQGSDAKAVAKLVLTASGGPFYGYDKEQLRRVTREEALAHPNWQMGDKITIDSATMMNKGLECIEAARLFSIPMEQIDVVVHRQSLLHSMVVFCDGSTLAQLGPPDMRLPIQYALTWPERLPSPVTAPVWADVPALTFAPPDEENFPAPALARTAFARGGTSPAVLSGANEAAVAQFLSGQITLPDIAARVASALERLPPAEETLDNILAADRAARAFVNNRE